MTPSPCPSPCLIHNGKQQTLDGPPLDLWTIDDRSSPAHGATFATCGPQTALTLANKILEVTKRFQAANLN